jgi:hypothetical protein
MVTKHNISVPNHSFCSQENGRSVRYCAFRDTELAKDMPGLCPGTCDYSKINNLTDSRNPIGYVGKIFDFIRGR